MKNLADVRQWWQAVPLVLHLFLARHSAGMPGPVQCFIVQHRTAVQEVSIRKVLGRR